MRELSHIVAAYDALSREGARGALATVVAIEGSSYRRIGARMLIAMDGQHWGSVSGGCLEKDVARRARNVIDTGEAIVCRYETDGDDPLDPSWTPADPGASLGCGGSIEILIELATPHVMDVLRRVARERSTQTLVTVARVGGEINAQPADRVETVRDPQLRDAMMNDLACADRVETRRHVFGHGWADVLIERIVPPPSLAIFGNGTDVEPLEAITTLLGWHVVRDDVDAPSCACDAAVIMTHNLRRDRTILSALLASDAPGYIGTLGPKHRTERLLETIESSIIERSRERLFYPVGLDIGAHTPEQVALSIAAEIQAFFNDRTGGRLRDSDGSIHGPMRDTARTEANK